jgi:hypothetical protein
MYYQTPNSVFYTANAKTKTKQNGPLVALQVASLQEEIEILGNQMASLTVGN